MEGTEKERMALRARCRRRSVPYYGRSGLSERRMRLCFSVALCVPRSVSVVKIACLLAADRKPPVRHIGMTGVA